MRNERGQVLPLFAVLLVGLFALAALAVDVSGAYSARQAYRTAADAAALAGAQDLQVANSRVVGAGEYTKARQDAQASIEGQYGPAICGAPVGNRSNCTFASASYQFQIITPLPPGACQSCDIARSVQVNMINPNFQLSFAHALGFGGWRVASTAVAGLQFNHSYAIVTLRPPKSPAIPGVRDIEIGGQSQIVVKTGDVGTNANMVYGGVLSLLTLDSGYRMDYYDPFNGPLWGSNPPGTPITTLIPDPGYPVPLRAGAPVGGTDVAGCPAIALAVQSNPQYAPSVPMAGGAPDMSNIKCFTKGIWSASPSIPNGGLAIFEPGLYFFDGGVDVQGSIIGGYTPASEGVAFVFPETQNTMFKVRTNGGGVTLAQVVALNAGTRYLNLGPGGVEATAAHDYAGGLVETNTSPAKLMSVIVPPDLNCPVTYPVVATCSNFEENRNTAIDLSGNTSLYLAGVQYAPTDNVTISGNTATGGYVGQIWAWTLKYTGRSTINQEGDQNQGPGTLRLDAACTAPGTSCIP
jgi:Putative Flp pilus-assembly TadE/G-like